jgi:hypothetical protein
MKIVRIFKSGKTEMSMPPIFTSNVHDLFSFQNRSSTWVYILRLLNIAPHTKPYPKSALSSIFIKMCQLHTEVAFAFCGHICFQTAYKKSCDCKKKFLGMMVAGNSCPDCPQAPNPLREPISQEPLTKTIVADTEDWLRGLKDFGKVEAAIYGPLPVRLHSSQLESDEAQTAALVKMSVRFKPVPLDYQPNDFLTDRCDFISPKIKVVPPGTIQPEHEKCGICWGSLTTNDPEACSGRGARRLPCGHIFGRKCLVSTFNIGNEDQPRGTNRCPACRQQFRVSLTRYSSPLPFYNESIKSFSNNMASSLGTIGLGMLILLLPYIYAVAISMDIGVKVNVFSDHWLRTTPRWLRITLAVLMLPAIAEGFYGWSLIKAWVYLWISSITSPFWAYTASAVLIGAVGVFSTKLAFAALFIVTPF